MSAFSTLIGVNMHNFSICWYMTTHNEIGRPDRISVRNGEKDRNMLSIDAASLLSTKMS